MNIVVNYTKALILSVLVLFVTHFAWGQGHDPLFQPATDPVKLVKIFPNPATDYVSVQFEAPLAKTVKLTLHNIIGNTLEVESEIIDEHEIRLRVKDLPPGVYLLAVKDEGSVRTSLKFLKR